MLLFEINIYIVLNCLNVQTEIYNKCSCNNCPEQSTLTQLSELYLPKKNLFLKLLPFVLTCTFIVINLVTKTDKFVSFEQKKQF